MGKRKGGRPACVWLLLLLALLLLPGAYAAAEAQPIPPRDGEGFLLTGEYVLRDDERGAWRYLSPTLQVDVVRVVDAEKKLTWYEAEIRSRGERWGMVTAQEGKHISAVDWPHLVARRNRSVLAINGDYALARYPKHNADVGILIREGHLILSAKTRPSTRKSFPNLDTLALFEDGDMRVFASDEHTAEEYLDMGAVDVLSFGPYLIRDGIINEKAYQLGKVNAPRTGIGMAGKGHYFAIMAEGRHKKSIGVPVSFLAEKLLEKGCVTAMNLDGGETACMIFMGQQLNKVGGANNKPGYARRTSELLAIGTSDLAAGQP